MVVRTRSAVCSEPTRSARLARGGFLAGSRRGDQCDVIARARGTRARKEFRRRRHCRGGKSTATRTRRGSDAKSDAAGSLRRVLTSEGNWLRSRFGWRGARQRPLRTAVSVRVEFDATIDHRHPSKTVGLRRTPAGHAAQHRAAGPTVRADFSHRSGFPCRLEP